MSNPSLRLHRFALSGHCHRVELLLSLLGLPVTLVEVDLRGGEQKRAPFTQLNPLGQVPVLEDGDLVLADSNAILVYLAGRYDLAGQWLPRDPVGAAQVQRWLSQAAGPLAFGPAAARVIKIFGAPLDLVRATAIATQVLSLIERTVASRPYLVGQAPTIADVAMYAYTARAPEGGLDLAPSPHVRAWLARVEALPGFVAMPEAR